MDPSWWNPACTFSLKSANRPPSMSPENTWLLHGTRVRHTSRGKNACHHSEFLGPQVNLPRAVRNAPPLCRVVHSVTRPRSLAGSRLRAAEGVSFVIKAKTVSDS